MNNKSENIIHFIDIVCCIHTILLCFWSAHINNQRKCQLLSIIYGEETPGTHTGTQLFKHNFVTQNKSAPLDFIMYCFYNTNMNMILIEMNDMEQTLFSKCWFENIQDVVNIHTYI